MLLQHLALCGLEGPGPVREGALSVWEVSCKIPSDIIQIECGIPSVVRYLLVTLNNLIRGNEKNNLFDEIFLRWCSLTCSTVLTFPFHSVKKVIFSKPRFLQ